MFGRRMGGELLAAIPSPSEALSAHAITPDELVVQYKVIPIRRNEALAYPASAATRLIVCRVGVDARVC